MFTEQLYYVVLHIWERNIHCYAITFIHSKYTILISQNLNDIWGNFDYHTFLFLTRVPTYFTWNIKAYYLKFSLTIRILKNQLNKKCFSINWCWGYVWMPLEDIKIFFFIYWNRFGTDTCSKKLMIFLLLATNWLSSDNFIYLFFFTNFSMLT